MRQQRVQIRVLLREAEARLSFINFTLDGQGLITTDKGVGDGGNGGISPHLKFGNVLLNVLIVLVFNCRLNGYETFKLT